MVEDLKRDQEIYKDASRSRNFLRVVYDGLRSAL